MKKLIAFIMTTFAAANMMAQNEVDCPFTSINSNITSNTTLSASTLYRIEGCVHVTSGNTLTIPAATTIMGQKSSTGTLIIDKGAHLIVQGTSINPVLFTCDQTPTHKNYGDWGGLVIEGNATNNVSGGTISITDRACSISGGGVSDADSSGSLQFLRVEYASYGLTLLSVGNKTVLNDIQVSYAANDAFQFLGGTVNAKFLVSLNARGSDARYEYGNRSNNQFFVAARLASDAHTSTGDKSNSIVMANNETTPFSGTPATHPVLSNFTLFGPAYCGATGLDTNFKNAILNARNTEGGIYNSILTGWPIGYFLQDAATVDNADINVTLNFSENTFFNNPTHDFSTNELWPATCATSMTDWITGTAAGACAQAGNQIPLIGTLGYNASVCGDYTMTAPNFTLGMNNLASPDYTDVSELNGNPFFDHADNRGAFSTSTAWTSGWTNWNPQAFNPCPTLPQGKATGVTNVANESTVALQLAPNPSDGTTFAIFDVTKADRAAISVIDNVGRTVRIVHSNVEKGTQRVAVDTKGLATGIYTVKVQLASGGMMHTNLLVK